MRWVKHSRVGQHVYVTQRMCTLCTGTTHPLDPRDERKKERKKEEEEEEEEEDRKKEEVSK